jgi:hypothetical protein
MLEGSMDEIVKQAMVKWPNVPHCYGWLALDARGVWRMRDESAQRAGAPGDKLTNPALVGFINRNYLHDERGCWYFQNGPQRVYVKLETTPFIARTSPAEGLLVQTGQALPRLDRVCMTENGEFVVQSGEIVAQVDDRDAAQLLGALELDGKPVSDDALMAWLQDGARQLCLRYREQLLPVERASLSVLAERFGFVREPRPFVFVSPGR